jgi:transmembrane sensor
MRKLSFPLPQRKSLPDSFFATSWNGIVQRRHAKARMVRRTLVLAAAATVLALVALIVTRSPFAVRQTTSSSASSGELHLRSGGPFVAHAHGPSGHELVELDDGSSIDLGSGARIEPVRNDAHTIDIDLSAGEATFDVRPGGPRVWSVRAGKAVVTVLGTKFSVRRDDRGVRVAVERGVVLVRAAALPDRRLAQGEELVVAETGGDPSGDGLPTLRPEDLPSAPQAPSSPGRVEGRRTDTVQDGERLQQDRWVGSARAADYHSAYDTLGHDGVTREATRTNDPSLLMLLADVARLSGHPGDAVAPLQRVLDVAPGDASAPLAAFMLGKIELDSLGNPARAASFFAQCIDLGAPRSVAEDAYLRWVEALARANDRAGAKRVHELYRSRYPSGRHLNETRSWIETH